jgi:hypothetical protein
LSAIDDIDAEGPWVLEITDDTKGETGTLHSWGLTIARIYPNDTPIGTSDLTIDDVMLAEGRNRTTDFVFTVTRTGETSTTVTVNYATANGTAVVDSDYIVANGTLTFDPGVETQSITVRVKGDRTPEEDEVFYVNLSDASSNATISDPQGEGTIVNDDGELSLAGVGPQFVLPVGTPRRPQLRQEASPCVVPPEVHTWMDVVVGEGAKRALTQRELHQARVLDDVAEIVDEDLLDLLTKMDKG